MNKIRGEYSLNPKQYYVDLLFVLQAANPVWDALPDTLEDMPPLIPADVPMWDPEEGTTQDLLNELVSALETVVSIIRKFRQKMD